MKRANATANFLSGDIGMLTSSRIVGSMLSLYTKQNKAMELVVDLHESSKSIRVSVIW